MTSFQIRTSRLILRDFCAADFPVVHAYGSDADVVRYMDWGPSSETDTLNFLARAASSAAADPRTAFDLAVTESESGVLLGGAGIYVDPSGTQAMLGYCLARSSWHRGVATEAARALLRFGFGELTVHRIWAGCDPENVGSRRVLEKLGMRHEGHLRENVYVRSSYRDTLIFAVLREEWAIHSRATA